MARGAYHRRLDKETTAPPSDRRSRGISGATLERNLGRKLDATRPAATEEWIADAHVASCSERQETDAAARRVQPIVCRVSNKVRQVRIGEVGMIEQVKEFSSDLQIYALCDRCVLVGLRAL